MYRNQSIDQRELCAEKDGRKEREKKEENGWLAN